MPFSQHYTILFMREHPEWAERAAAFFAPHWNDPIDEFRADKRHVTRADCVAMNQMAEEICSLSSITPDTIRPRRPVGKTTNKN